MNNNNDIECIICQDEAINSPFIKYQHTCGTYDIHQSCLDDWFIENSHSCIICRNNIISSSDSASESESISSRELTDNSNLDNSYDADIESANDHVYSNINLQDDFYRSYNSETSYSNTQNTSNKLICAILFFSVFLAIVILLFFI